MEVWRYGGMEGRQVVSAIAAWPLVQVEAPPSTDRSAIHLLPVSGAPSSAERCGCHGILYRTPVARPPAPGILSMCE